MKVLITGATGFLGYYIVDRLAQDKVQIVAMGRNSTRGNKLTRPNVTFFQGDFTNIDHLRSAMDGVTHVIHAGALSSAWGQWKDFYQTNVIGTKNVLDLCRQLNIHRLVYISSPSIYSAKYDHLNIKEDEVNQKNDLNYYIQSKIMSERLFQHYPDIASVILRPRAIIGIGDTSVVPRLLKVNKKIGIPLFQKGENLIDVTCVENVAYAVQLALFKPNAVGKTYNVTNGDPRLFKELLDLFFQHIDAKPKYRKFSYRGIDKLAQSLEFFYKTLHIKKEPPITPYTLTTIAFSQTLDITSIKKDLGYHSIISIEEGIEKYASYYNKY
ncbi:NAD-dependent epimerase/dehydratase family protein [Aerococcaceae bacterium WGS1372]